MSQRKYLAAFAFLVASAWAGLSGEAQAAGKGQPYDWNRFYYYPYVYYPHNFQANEEFDSLYYRYPANRRIPVYNSSWYNFYPTDRPYHRGHHFILDVF